MPDQTFAVESSFTITNDQLTPYLQRLSQQLETLDSKLVQSKAALSQLGGAGGAAGMQATSGAARSATTALQDQLNAITGVSRAQKDAYESAQVFALGLGNVRNAAAQASAPLGQATQAVTGLGHATGPTREAIVLLHEAISGRFSRIPGSLLVMSEYFGGIGLKAIGAIAGVGLFAAAVYEIAKNAIETNQALLSLEGTMAVLGQGPGGPEGTARVAAQVEALGKQWGLSRRAAAEFAEATQGSMRVADQSTRDAVQNISASLATMHNQMDKLPDIAKTLGSKTQSFSGLKEISNQYGLGLEGMINEAETKGESLKATQGKVIGALEEQLRAYAGEAAKFQQEVTFSATAIRSLEQAFTTVPGNLGERVARDQPKPPSPLDLIPPRAEAGQEDPAEVYRRHVAEAEAAVQRLHASSDWLTRSPAQRAQAEGAEWSKIQTPGAVAGSPDAARVANEQARLKVEAQTAANAQIIEADRQREAVLSASGRSNRSADYAAQAEDAQKELALSGLTYEQKRDAEQRLAVAQASASAQATTSQLKDLEAVAAATKSGSAERVKAEQAVADYAVKAYGRTSDEARSALQRLATAQREQADQQAKAVDVAAEQQIDAIKKAEQEQLTLARNRDTKSLLGDPSAQAAANNAIIANAIAAIDQVEEKRKAAADDDVAKTAEIERQKVDLDQAAAEQMIKNNKEAADQIESDWDKVNKDIGQGLASSIMDAMEGRKGGLGQALAKWADKQISSVMGTAMEGILKQAEGALGLSGSSPGAIAGSGLNKLGLGSVGSFLGLGGGEGGGAGGAAGSAEGAVGASKGATTAANTAALHANTAALTGHTGSTATNTAATAANTGAVSTDSLATATNTGASVANTGMTSANTTSQVINSVSTDLNSATQESAVIAFVANTIATTANTIATIFQAVADMMSFAQGGDPPVGQPSLVGEHGPELIVPSHMTHVFSNDNLRAMGRANQGFGVRPGASYNFAGMGSTSSASTTNATFRQTNNFSAGPQRSLHEQLASHVRQYGRSGVRSMVAKMARGS